MLVPVTGWAAVSAMKKEEHLPWESKTKERMVFKMIPIKDSLLPMGKVWSLDLLGLCFLLGGWGRNKKSLVKGQLSYLWEVFIQYKSLTTWVSGD